MSGLEELLANSPPGPWDVMPCSAVWFWSRKDRRGLPMEQFEAKAQLIALAPDLARLCLDMGEQLMIENEKHPNYNITKLVARLHGIADNKDAA